MMDPKNIDNWHTHNKSNNHRIYSPILLVEAGILTKKELAFLIERGVYEVN